MDKPDKIPHVIALTSDDAIDMLLALRKRRQEKGDAVTINDLAEVFGAEDAESVTVEQAELMKAVAIAVTLICRDIHEVGSWLLYQNHKLQCPDTMFTSIAKLLSGDGTFYTDTLQNVPTPDQVDRVDTENNGAE